jgi:hypothetical protein
VGFFDFFSLSDWYLQFRQNACILIHEILTKLHYWQAIKIWKTVKFGIVNQKMHYPEKYIIQKIDTVLSTLRNYAQTGKISNPEIIQQEIEEYLQMPIGEALFENIIKHPFIIKQYMLSLFHNNLNRAELGEQRLDLMVQLNNEIFGFDDESMEWIRVRKFNPMGDFGYYYGAPFSVNHDYYGFWNDEPILITTMPQEWLNEEQFSETGWITRSEVRILAALSFSMPSWHGPKCYFFLSEVYNFPSNFVFRHTREFTATTLKRLQIAISILSRLRSKYSTTSKLVSKDISPYKFRTNELLQENAERFFNCFDVRDNLELRTAFCLLKSAMLWSYGLWYGSHIFDEDAVANMFFGLEGCLRLIHRQFSGGKNFAIEPTLVHIEKVFPKKPGYVDMITFSYEQRIEIVHPEPRTDREWIPFITQDDFYETYGMVIDLIYYAITGETLPVIDE